MKFKIKKYDVIIGLVLFLIFYFGIITFYSLFNFKPTFDSTLSFRLHEETKNYQAHISEYREFSSSVFNQFFNSKKIVSAIDSYNQSNQEEKDTLRRQLFDSLNVVFQVMQQKNFATINIFNPGGESIISFSPKDDSDAAPTELRSSTKMMMQHSRYLEGFEEGSNGNYYRFIYPLYHHGTFVGSVEMSVSMIKFLAEEEKSFVGAFRFLLSNALAEKIAMGDKDSLYHDYNLKGYKMYGSLHRTYKKNKFLLDSIFRQLNAQLEQQVVEARDHNIPVIKYIRHIGLNWLVTLFPVKNIAGDQVAFVAAYEIYYPIDFLRRNKRIMHTAAAILSLIITLFFLFINTERKKAVERHNAIKVAKEKAEEAARLKSSFLANMSHEIRTPMNGVVGMTEILKQTGLKNDQKEYVSIIESSASLMLNVINDILDFTKIDSNKIEIESISFRTGKVIEDVADTLVLSVEKKGIAMLTYIDPAIPDHLIGDPLRLRQVILNLANNAVKFTSEGEVIISAELVWLIPYNEDDSNRGKATVLFKVKDTGIGISKEAQAKLFEAFVQADATINRKYGGTGLGLAISKQLVELMGGKLAIESEIGKGSVFSFQLTFDIDNEAKDHDFTDLEDLSKLKVLVLDDNKSDKIIFKKYFSFWNIVNDEASDINEALKKTKQAKANKTPYNLIIVDFQLSGQSAFDFSEMLINKKLKENTRLILFTSISDKISTDTITESGFDGYLYKPLKYYMFRKIILKAVNYQLDESASHQPGNKESEFVYEVSDLKILLAEDNLVNQKVAAVMLNKFGYINVDIANNGTEAVQMYLDNQYDLILMDIQMPVMSGLEATQKIRAYEKDNPSVKRVKIIALTANALENDVKLYLQEGMDNVLTKPFRPMELKDILSRDLEKKD